MKLKKLTKKEFKTFADKNPEITFHQTEEWANLKKVNNVTNLLGACCCWCSNLEEVEIGKGVKSIGKNLFYGDSKLTDIFYNGSIDEWNKISKDPAWNANTKIQTIICKDGNET